MLGLSSFVKGVLFIKVQETWVRNRWPEMEEEGSLCLALFMYENGAHRVHLEGWMED